MTNDHCQMTNDHFVFLRKRGGQKRPPLSSISGEALLNLQRLTIRGQIHAVAEQIEQEQSSNTAGSFSACP